MTAVKEKLAGNSHANAFDRQRLGYMRRGAGVGVESLPRVRPEVGNDFGRDARAFLSRGGINEGDMDVIPFEQRILAINALAAKTERETVIVLCVKHKRIKYDQLTFTQRDCFAL